MSDKQGLLDEVDKGLWTTLGILADWHTDQGEDATAAGYRWLVKHKKHPVPRAKGWAWLYMSPYGVSQSRTEAKRPPCLPLKKLHIPLLSVVGTRMEPGSPAGMQWMYKKLSDAFRSAAEVIGALLASRALKEVEG